MGTRGLYSYKYRRRYWTRYSNWDSYPEGLGSKLVAQIPSDAEECKQWVMTKKAEFDARVADKSKPGENDKSENADNDYVSRYVPELDTFIEWTYVIDLDHNLFIVNGVIYVDFKDIPRGGKHAWIAVFEPNHPARLEGIDASETCGEHVALYNELGATASLDVKTPPHAFGTCEHIMRVLFACFCDMYDPRLVGGQRALSGEFAGTAGVIATLASWGLFRLAGDKITTSFVRDEAPASEVLWNRTEWWYRDTLLVLEVDLCDDERLHAAIARAVLNSRQKSRIYCMKQRTRAFIVSLREMVVVDITNDSVQHSEVMTLVPREESSYKSSLGFSVLMDHFTPAFPAGSETVTLPLPEPVLEDIFDLCDRSSLDVLCKTCKTIRTLVMRRPRFEVGPYRLLHYVPGSEDVFTALDTRTGRTERVKLNVHQRPKGWGFLVRDGNESSFDGYPTRLLGLPTRRPGYYQRYPRITRTDHTMQLVSLRCDPVA